MLSMLFASKEEEKIKNKNITRRTYLGSFVLYPLTHLNMLIGILQNKMAVKFNEDHLRIRYLVDTNKKLWFAEEGSPTEGIPAHYQMTGQSTDIATCLSAGTLTFSSDFSCLIAIDHKSGDFRPPFNSIKWLLAILVNSESLLPAGLCLGKDLDIEELTDRGGSFKTHKIEITALRTMVDAWLSEEEKSSLANQSLLCKTVSYQSDAAPAAPRTHNVSNPLFFKIKLAESPKRSRPVVFITNDTPSHVSLPPEEGPGGILKRAAVAPKAPPSSLPASGDEEEEVSGIGEGLTQKIHAPF